MDRVYTDLTDLSMPQFRHYLFMVEILIPSEQSLEIEVQEKPLAVRTGEYGA